MRSHNHIQERKFFLGSIDKQRKKTGVGGTILRVSSQSYFSEKKAKNLCSWTGLTSLEPPRGSLCVLAFRGVHRGDDFGGGDAPPGLFVL